MNRRIMHVTWLVSNPEAFFRDPGPTSRADRIVQGLTYEEWFELFFVVLGVGAEEIAHLKNSGRDARILEYDDEISDYPMLSRIHGVYWDSVFNAGEVQTLEDECRRLLKSSSNPLASKGLEKLLEICAEARNLGLSIYMMCN